MMRLNAGVRLHKLTDAFEAAGYGAMRGADLRGACRVLVVLGRMLDLQLAAAGYATVDQIADRAGFGRTWTRICLTVLESMGLITWIRGGIGKGGVAQPSHITVNKRALTLLVGEARGDKDAREAARAMARQARVAKARCVKPRHTKNRWSEHVPLTEPLPPNGEVSPRMRAGGVLPSGMHPPRPAPVGDASAGMASVRAALAAAMVPV